MENAVRTFIANHVAIVSDLQKKTALAYFTATLSGKEEDYTLLSDTQMLLEKIYTNKEDFALLSSFIASDKIKDQLLKRQIELLFLSYKAKQVDKERLEKIIALQNKIENTYATFRPEIQGRKVSDNEIKNILADSTTSKEVEEAWLSSKQIGPLVASDVIEIVNMRNAIAQELGYANYHEMSLQLDEQDPEEMDILFDELDELTREAFAKEKEHIDEYLSKRFGIHKKDLMPRHYQDRFFQEAPKIYPINLDSYYKDKDLVELSSTYYASLGLPVDTIISKSDLFERDGKYQHAYCLSIDKMGDVRIVCNLKSNHYWMNTQLHELGHAIYERYLDHETTPYLLKDPAHTFTTEAIAMLFGRFASNPQWLFDLVHISEKEKEEITKTCFDTLRLEQLVLSRWVQVMYRFEKSMYKDPDQDLNALWWNLVERYQLLKRPSHRNEPDWATKIHIACYPCYYHNYLLGEILASQLYYYINEHVLHVSEDSLQSFYNKPEVGNYLKEKIFYAGRKYHWNEMIKKATGENLTPKYYAKQFVS